MIRATILLATFGLPVLLHAQRTRALEQLAYTMAGSYTSAEQAKAASLVDSCFLAKSKG